MGRSSGSKWLLMAGGTVAALGVIGYCIWFDRQRRSSPEFRRKLRGKRQQKFDIPSKFESQEQMQHYFMQQLQEGEMAMLSNKFDSAANHFVNAIVVSGNVQLVLQALQNTAPPQVLSLTMKKLSERAKGKSSATTRSATFAAADEPAVNRLTTKSSNMSSNGAPASFAFKPAAAGASASRATTVSYSNKAVNQADRIDKGGAGEGIDILPGGSFDTRRTSGDVGGSSRKVGANLADIDVE